MKTYSQEDIEITIANAKKLLSFSSITYPLKELDDRLFEILIYSLFKKKLKTTR
mgnify:CR=1 FL=1